VSCSIDVLAERRRRIVDSRNHSHRVENRLEKVARLAAEAGCRTNPQRGGRVLDVAAIGADVNQARTRAYAAVDMISWPGMHYRRDIALSALS
jgi:phosphoribosylamine-glycine ligase